MAPTLFEDFMVKSKEAILVDFSGPSLALFHRTTWIWWLNVFGFRFQVACWCTASWACRGRRRARWRSWWSSAACRWRRRWRWCARGATSTPTTASCASCSSWTASCARRACADPARRCSRASACRWSCAAAAASTAPTPAATEGPAAHVPTTYPTERRWAVQNYFDEFYLLTCISWTILRLLCPIILKYLSR